MWDDHPTAPTPTSPPVSPPSLIPPISPPPIAPNSQSPVLRPPHRNWWQWWLTLLLILLITGGVGYFASQYWQDLSNWTSSLIYDVPSITNDNGTGINDDQVAWQSRVLISDLSLLSSGSGIGSSVGLTPVSLAKYYKVGQFISGPYDNGDLIIAVLPNTDVTRFYYFARSRNDLILLDKHSPALSENSQIDQSKFSIDRDYQIARLFFPTRLNNPRSAEEPLVLVSTGNTMDDHWFDESLLANNWQKVFIDQTWGDVYTDPLPNPDNIGTTSNSSSAGAIDNYVVPRCGFYLQAPDSTIRTYKLIPSILQSDILQTDIPAFVWADGTSSVDEYIMFDVDECKQTNLAAVVPNAILDELVLATNTDQNVSIYKLKDNNHSLLKTLFKEANSRIDNEGLTYQKFLDSHPIFFWQDSFGRLIKFQNKKYVALMDGCS